MASKTSIILSTIDKYSKPFQNATKSAGKLNDEIKTTATRLKGLEKNQQSVARFKKLSSQLDATKIKMAGAKVEISQLQKAGMQASEVVTQYSASLRTAEKAVLSAAEAHGKDSKEVKLATAEVKKLTREKNRAEQQRKKETAGLKTATAANGKLTDSFKKQSSELGGLRNKLKDAGINLKALNAEELRLAKHTKSANRALEQQQAKLKKIQKLESRIAGRKAQRGELAGQAVGVAVKMAPMMMAGKQAMDYEATFADVKKVVNFKDDAEADSYKQQMLQKAGDLGMSQEGLAQIVTAAGQSGIEKDQLIQFAESATKMSTAWDVSAEEAGATLATWRASMGLNQETALDLADATNYLSNNMNAKAADIANVMVRQGSTAMGSGMSANEVAALSATLIAGGAKSETAATALKNISGRLTAGYAATGAQQTAFDKIGFDAEELAVSMQEDAQGTIVSVMRALQDVDASERGAVISQIFGEEVKGAVSKLVLTIDDPKNGLLASFARVANATDRTGSVNEEFANKEKTRAHQLAKLKSKFSAMMIAIGDRLLPVLDAVLPPLMTVVDGIASFATNNEVLTTGILGVVGAFGLLSAGMIAFKLAKGGVLNVLDTFKLGKTKLSGTTDITTKSANRASVALAKMNRELSGIANNGGNNGYDQNRNKRAGKRSTKRRKGRGRGGKFGRLAGLTGLLGSGATLSMFSSSASASDTAMAGADLAGTVGGLTQLLPAGGKLLKGAGKLFRPLDLVLSGIGVASAISSGDNKQIGGSIGDMAGGLGGAAAGAMAGAALGSVVPILGTAVGGIIGGIIGGYGGGELGGFLGETVGSWFGDDLAEKSKLEAPKLAGAELNPQAKADDGINIKETLSTVAKFANPSFAIGSFIRDSIFGDDSEKSKLEAPKLAGAELKPQSKVDDSVNIKDTVSTIAKFANPSFAIGSFISDSISGWFSEDKTAQSAPKEIAKQAEKITTANKQINFSPTLNFTPTGDPDYDNKVSMQIMDMFKAELSPMFLGNDVAVRSDASLTDGATT